ncbi:unannotated protein [freshwater metagenome]|uniref:Unannotated protein n=1 Tax=freshwater metagenome TaxID=449393 RepID=A0A6J7L725_9ZZZZ|nr:AMP-binding protein [Actinomycetota bacterium]
MDQSNGIPTSEPHSLVIDTGFTTRDVLRAAALSHPEREAYVHGERRINYAQLEAQSKGAGSLLLEAGVKVGDVVAILLPSGVDYAIWYLACLRIGAIATGVNRRLAEPEQRSIISRTMPRVSIVMEPNDAPFGLECGHLITSEAFESAYLRPLAEEPTINESTVACIVWTSGTTGEPKGAVYDHARLEAISRNIGDLTADADRRLVSLPFAHVGYMTRVWDEIAHGTTLVMTGEPWSPSETLRLLRDESITVGTGVPTQWELVLAHPDLALTDCSHLRLCGIGGSAVSPDLIRRMRFALACPVMNRYTSTEAGVSTGTEIGDPDEVVAETVGKPASEVELRLVDGDGDDVEPGAVGEILLRSPMVMIGYWQDPSLTSSVLEADGWLRTGDLARRDESGNLRIVGRLKEMYIRGGYNVYPAEIENVLSKHPQIGRVAIVPAPAPVLGEIGVAFIVPRDAANPPTLEALRSWLKNKLADYKAPERIVIMNELPLTSMLKVDKKTLTELAKAKEE